MYLISCGFLYRWGFEAQNRSSPSPGRSSHMILPLPTLHMEISSFIPTVWRPSCLLRNHDKYPQCWLVDTNTVFKQSCTCSEVLQVVTTLRKENLRHLNMWLIHHGNDATSSSSLLKDQESTQFALCCDSCFRLRSLSGRLWLEPTHLSNGVRWPPLSHAKVGISSVVSFALTRARTQPFCLSQVRCSASRTSSRILT